MENICLKLIISEDNIEKYKLDLTMDITELLNDLSTKFNLKIKKLVYWDTDVETFCNLNETTDLYNKCTVKLIHEDTGTINEDTKLNVASTSSSAQKWPELFEVPDFKSEPTVNLFLDKKVNNCPSKIRKK